MLREGLILEFIRDTSPLRNVNKENWENLLDSEEDTKLPSDEDKEMKSI